MNFRYYVRFVRINKGLREIPYWNQYSRPRMFIHTLTTSKYFDISIAGIIGLNVITMALEYYMMPGVRKLYTTIALHLLYEVQILCVYIIGCTVQRISCYKEMQDQIKFET